MDARNFRFLFDNTSEGIVHSGCVLDTIEDKTTNFVYLCGVRSTLRSKKETLAVQNRILGMEKSDNPCHILVLASFSLGYIREMLKIIKKRKVMTVIIPYVAPVQRLALYQRCMDELEADRELQAFTEQPYLYLKHAGIENIYFLYGNGEDITGDINLLETGHHFKSADRRDLDMIKELEGLYIPAVKAGYILENKWLFYFGYYGRDINIYEQFSLKFFGRKKRPVSYRGNGAFNLELRQVVHEYIKQFGEMITADIVMFQGPLSIVPREVDSVMAGKVYTKNQDCVPEIPGDGRNCFWKCVHKEDHAVFKRHKNPDRRAACIGMLLLGNIDMNKYLVAMRTRFDCIIDQVRAVTLPGCGKREYWNRQCLSLLYGEDTKYWVCGLDWETSPAVISDIVVANPRNHIVTISEEYGYCFSGYLIPPVEKE